MSNKQFQHYIPATYLAQFSSNIAIPRRKSLIWAGSKESGKIYNWTVESVGGENNFYEIENKFETYKIDSVWYGYEASLANAINQLINGTISALTWATILVPFVAGLMVRGLDFNKRFKNRLISMGLEIDKDQTNLARLMEIQRILSPILCSRWRVFKTTGIDIPLLTNETGYIPFYNPIVDERGFSIPLSNQYLLIIIPSRLKYISYFDHQTWRPLIHYGYLDPDNHIGFNHTVNKYASKYVIGRDQWVVKKFLTPEIQLLPELEMMGFINGSQMRVHEFMWHRLVAGLMRAEKGENIHDFPLDYENLKGLQWISPLMMGINFPSYSLPPDIYREKNLLVANLYKGVVVYD